MRGKRSAMTLAVLVAVGTLAIAASAGATVSATRDPSAIASAIATPGLIPASPPATLPMIAPAGNPLGIANTGLSPFPRVGTTYAVLSSGDATQADQPSGSSSADDQGTSQQRGTSAYDVTVVSIPLAVPSGDNCLSFDFRFLSEEYPDFIDSEYNDAFIAEIDQSTWTTQASAITGLDNDFALDANQQPVTIKSTGPTSMSPAEAAGTPYGGATAPLRAQTAVTPGAHTLYLSIFDQSDRILDTVAFVDNLRAFMDPVGCPRGSRALGPAVAIVAPAANAIISSSPSPTLNGTAGNAPGDSATVTVRIYRGTVPAGAPVQTLSATRDGIGWSVQPAALPDGTYTALASQADGEGIVGLSGGRTFSVNAERPAVTIDSPAPGAAIANPQLFGSASDVPGDNATVNVQVFAGTSATGTPLQTMDVNRFGSSWSADLSLPADGIYTAVAAQGDSFQRTGSSGPVTFTYDTVGPTVTIDGPSGATTFTTSSPMLSGTAGDSPGDDPVVEVDVFSGDSTAGEFVQSVVPTRSGSTWSANLNDLPDGTYTAQAVQRDAAGNISRSGGWTFAVRGGGSRGGAQSATPSLGVLGARAGDRDGDGIPDDQDTSDGSAPPVPGKSVDVRVVSGDVFIKYPKGKGARAATPTGFVPLKGAANIPVGSQLDTGKGRVALTSAADTGAQKTQTADFYEGIFEVKQAVPKKKPKKATALVTDLVLKGASASQCAPLKGARAAAANKKKGAKSVLGKLWGNGKGKFRTSGKYSSATVRGTIWLTQDECDGTLTKVARGTVLVQDFKRKKTVTVKAGHSYLARAQRAASKAKRR
jgi:hypothetical protein